MNATKTTTIEISSDGPTCLDAGTYLATKDTIVTLYHSKGDSRREIEWRTVRAGETFAVLRGVNGHWTGAELTVEEYGDVATGTVEKIG